jgi:hypothetical protein
LVGERRQADAAETKSKPHFRVLESAALCYRNARANASTILRKVLGNPQRSRPFDGAGANGFLLDGGSGALNKGFFDNRDFTNRVLSFEYSI